MVTFNKPQSIKPGILPRVSEYGKLQGVPKLSDEIEIIPESDWLDICKSEHKPECSSLVWNINDQNGYGSCASESSNKMIEIVRERCGLPRVHFNPLFTYHTVSGGRDGGSSLDENISFLMSKGACPEDVWARSNGFRRAPSSEAYDAAESYRINECYDLSTGRNYFLEMGTALLKGWPVYFAYDSHAVLAVELVHKSQATSEQLACVDAVEKEVALYRDKLRMNEIHRLAAEPLGRELVGGASDWLLVYANSWGNWGSGRGSQPYGFGTMRMSAITPSFGLFAARSVVEA